MKYLKLLEAPEVPIGVMILEGPEYLITFINPVICALWARKKTDLINRRLYDVLPELKGQGFEALLQNVYATGVPFLGQETPAILNRNGNAETVYFNFVYNPVRATDGSVEGVMVLATDATPNVQMKNALHAEQKRLYDLFMQAPAIIAVLRGPEHVFQLANDHFLKLIGRTTSIVGLSAREVLPEVNGQGYFELLDQVYSSGDPFIGKEMLVRVDVVGDGELDDIYVNFVMQPSFDAEGAIDGIMIHAVDVTNQVETRNKLKLSEERFRTLIQQSADAIQLVTPEGIVMYSSDSVVNVLGYTPEEIQGVNVSPYIHPDDMPYFSELFSELLKSPKNQISLEYRVKHKDGTWVWVESTITNHLDTPQINALVGNFRNITDRKKTEEQLQYDSRLFENISDAVFSTDGDFIIKTWNKGAEDVYGWKASEVLGKSGLKIMKTNYLNTTRENVLSSLNEEGVWKGEVLHTRKDGTEVPMLISAVVVKDSRDKKIGYLCVNRDISDRKALEKQKDEFLGIASHELKTPITSSKAYAQVLEAAFRKKGDVKSADMMTKIDTQLSKISNLISDLLDVTKIQSGKLMLHFDFFDFNELVSEVVDELQLTTQHQLIKQLSRTKTVYGDRERTGQVITNLITNATKYSPGRDKVLIVSKATASEILLSVEDFGVGIPKDKQAKVFEQFFRVTGAKENTFPGLGLGLYVSAQIIKRQGGDIWVESIEGKGSTFSFSLPLPSKKTK